MTLFANAPGYQTNITNMSESGLIVLAVGSIILGCALLIPVMLAGRAPRRTEPASMPAWCRAAFTPVMSGPWRRTGTPPPRRSRRRRWPRSRPPGMRAPAPAPAPALPLATGN